MSKNRSVIIDKFFKKLYNLSKDEGEDLKSYILQIVASVLAVISGLIALYVVGLSTTENIVDVENPVI